MPRRSVAAVPTLPTPGIDHNPRCVRRTGRRPYAFPAAVRAVRAVTGLSRCLWPARADFACLSDSDARSSMIDHYALEVRRTSAEPIP